MTLPVAPVFTKDEEKTHPQDVLNKPFKRISNGAIFELDSHTRFASLGIAKENYFDIDDGLYKPRNPNIQISSNLKYATGYPFFIENDLVGIGEFRQQVMGWGYYNPSTEQYRSQGTISQLLTSVDSLIYEKPTWKFELKFDHKGRLKETLILFEAPEVLPGQGEYLVLEVYSSGSMPQGYRYGLDYTKDSGKRFINNESFQSNYFKKYIGVPGEILHQGVYPVILDPSYDEQPDESTGLDTYTLDSLPTTNYGTNALLWMGYDNANHPDFSTIFIKFDLTAIPSGSQISVGTLTLWVNIDRSSKSATFKLYRLLRAWVEAEATFNIWSTGNSWTTGGGLGAGTDYDNNVVATEVLSGTDAPGTAIPWELDGDTYSYLEAMVGSSPSFANNGFIWDTGDPTFTNSYAYDSSSSATAGERPRLQITFIPGGRKAHRIRRR